MKNALYETETVMSASEYLTFNRAVLRRTASYVGSYIAAYVMFALIAVICVWKLSPWALFVPGIAMVLFPFIQNAQIKRRVKQAWKTNRTIQNLKTHLTFYDDGYVGTNTAETLEVRYDKLWRIYETPTNLYLMLGETQGTNVIKANCTPELIAFLQEKKAAIESRAAK